MSALRPIFFTSFLFFAHLSIVMYINTTVLSAFIDAKYTSIVFVLGAAGSILLLFVLPHIVQGIGLVKTAASIFILLAITLAILGTTVIAATFIGVFILYLALTGTVWYCNDLFVAHYSQAATVGHTRGSYLTINNGAIALMPVIAGWVVERSGFHSVYIVAASLLSIAAACILYSQRSFVDRPYVSATIPAAWNAMRHSPSLRRVAAINFLLQFFYVWMTLFTPLYLSMVLHFSWGQIGLMFSIMLVAFVLLQYPVGRWADTIGEKKLLFVGFTIAMISTLAFALLHTHSFIIYTAVLFTTRVGICMVEVLAETYFFKQITDRDEGIVSVYRMMNPLAYIIGPLTGWYIITTTSYTTLFIILATLLCFGAIYSLRLVDIR
ncbi:MAG: major facilitator superfamily transporter [Candidatus Nomurabacteria bacterium]|nr:major facilitator superfamily transporter [Candidatus Nomurabacteria bacterium]